MAEEEVVPPQEEDDGEEDVDQKDPADADMKIEDVIRIHSAARKRPWYPDTKMEDGVTYIKLSKYDSGLIYLVRGKGQNRHRSTADSSGNLKVQWWAEVQKLRN